MEADGSNQRNLTDPLGRMTSLLLGLRTAEHIAFVSQRDGNEEIYVMEADGSNLSRLTDHEARRLFKPSWSPDGRHIAFVSDRDGEQRYLRDGGRWNQSTPPDQPLGRVAGIFLGPRMAATSPSRPTATATMRFT